MDKRTVVNLIAGQEYELRSTRGTRVSFPSGSKNPKVVVVRDLGVWVPEPVPPEPPQPPTTGKSLTVTSIAALLTALADDTLDEIVVKNGTYRVGRSSSKAAESFPNPPGVTFEQCSFG